MAGRSLLTFRESDGSVSVEILGSTEDFADLVDPNDGSVLHTESFAMHGGEWRIASVTLTEEMMHIECVAASMLEQSPRQQKPAISSGF
jgi:hypothetical protein